MSGDGGLGAAMSLAGERDAYKQAIGAAADDTVRALQAEALKAPDHVYRAIVETQIAAWKHFAAAVRRGP